MSNNRDKDNKDSSSAQRQQLALSSNRRNSDNKDEDVAAVLLGAAVGVGAAYLLFKGFQAAFTTETDITSRYIQESYYHEGPEVEVVETIDACRKAVRKLKSRCAEKPLLGFDTEKLQKSKLASLLQLSDHTGYCVLFRMKKIDSIPWELKDLLEDKEILKLGVGTNHDILSLRPHGIDAAGTLDLRFVRQIAGLEESGCDGTLKSMALEHLGVNMSKTVRVTDWDAPMLSDKQINYAALDARTALDLYQYFFEYCSFRGFAKMQEYVDKTFNHNTKYL